MKWKLINIHKEESYDLNSFPFLIGRNPKANIICRQEWISKHHAHITCMGKHLYITDTSSNGVYVNAERIVKHNLHKIQNGDNIGFGIKEVKLYDFKLVVEGIANLGCDKLSLEVQLSGKQSELNGENNAAKVIEPITIPIKSNTLQSSTDEPKSLDLTNMISVPIKVEPNIQPTVVIDCIGEKYKTIDSIKDNALKPSLEKLKSFDLNNMNNMSERVEQNTLYDINVIKQEVKTEVDMEFLQIKREIAEMDYNEHEMAPIEISDSEDSEDDELLRALRNYVPDVVYVGTEASPEIQFELNSPIYNERGQTPAAPQKDLNQLTHEIAAKTKHKLPEIIPAQPLASTSRKRKANLDTTSNKPEHSVKSKKYEQSTKLITDPRMAIKKCDVMPSANRERMERNDPSMTVKPISSSFTKLKKIPRISLSSSSPPIVVVSPVLHQIGQPVASASRRHSHNNALISPIFNQDQHEHEQTHQTKIPPRKQHLDSWLATMYIKEFHTFFLRLFAWDISYFQVPFDITAVWEKFYGSPMTKMPMTYSDYRYYQRAMNSVIMAEIFVQAYREFSTMKQDEGSRAQVVKVNTFETYIEIVCYYYVGEKELWQRPFDCSLVKLSSCVETESKFFGIVGPNYTSKVKPGQQLPSTLESQCHSYPLHKHTYSIYTRRSCHVAEKSYIYVSRLFSLRSNLPKLSAIKNVHGGISKQILSPIFNQFLIPVFPMDPANSYLPMNDKQEEIVSLAMRFCQPLVESRFFLIEGPPGTGKSNVIVNIVLNTLKSLKKGDALLLVAQSNAAVNNLLRRITNVRKSLPVCNKTHVKIVRLGQFSQTAPDLIDFHLDKLVERNLRDTLFYQSPHLRHDYRKLKEQITELGRKTNRSHAEEQLYRLKEQKYTNFARDCLLRQYSKMWLQSRDKVLLNANLICSTIGSIHTFPFSRIKLQFKFCIMDEATQATEPDTLIPLAHGVRKFILVGDTKQLPPYNMDIPKEYMYNRSLYERLQRNLEESPNCNSIHKLDTQYRMRKEICSFPNRIFYGNSINTQVSTPRADIKKLVPYLVFEQSEGNKSKAYVNQREIDAIVTILKVIDKMQLSSQLLIGIISPYNDQKNELQRRLHQIHFQEHIAISVNTIDQFQGQEQDIILLSLVLRLANTFVDNGQRLNVALTRAKSCMYVLGSPVLFKSGALMTELQNDAQKRGLYIRLPTGQINEETLQHHLIS